MKPYQRILIVDDQKVNRDLLANLFQPEYKIMVAGDGEQAISAAANPQLRPDLILLDVMMPRMDGYEVCRRLKQNDETCAIPVIFVTSLGEVRDETKGLELGAVDYISKPFSPPIVRARVRNHLLLKSLRDSLEEQVAARTQALQAALRESQASELAKSEFIARMSHELRTPLNAIMSPIFLLMKRMHDPEDKNKLAQVYESSNHLLGLIDEILEFSRLESDENLTENHFNIHDFMTELHSKWHAMAEKKNIYLELEMHKINPHARFLGDSTLLKRALEPLLDNAIKFTDTGGVVLRVIPLAIIQDRISFQFEITDTGIGIDPGRIDEMFKPFTQVELTGTRRFSGVGLGLPLAVLHIKRLGGQLQAKGELGKGSILSFNVPFALVDDQCATEIDSGIASLDVIKSQLAELAILVKKGFHNTDQFVAERVSLWSATPWKDELTRIIHLVTHYNSKGVLSAIDAFMGKQSD
ncbi:MAG: response regulator [Magnetococcales bacterium]|nr:response regulator [Magnetococcales bacterium]